MSKKSITLTVVLTIVVAALLVFFPVIKDNFLIGTAPEFSGTRTRNPETDKFVLEFEVLNAEDTVNYDLEAGDELKITWDVQKGSVSLYIMDETQNVVYRADDRKAKDKSEFSVAVDKSGEYVVHISGKKATGLVTVEHNK